MSTVNVYTQQRHKLKTQFHKEKLKDLYYYNQKQLYGITGVFTEVESIFRTVLECLNCDREEQI